MQEELWEGDMGEFEFELVLKTLARLSKAVPWGRSPLGENELELTCTGEGPSSWFSCLCFQLSEEAFLQRHQYHCV